MTRRRDRTLIIALVCLLAAFQAAGQQKVNRVEQEQARSILHQVEETIVKNYFDPTFHGYDLHARFEDADKKLNDVPSLVAGLTVIGWAVEGLNDSHTFFIPPMRNVAVHSGWQMGMVGEPASSPLSSRAQTRGKRAFGRAISSSRSKATNPLGQHSLPSVTESRDWHRSPNITSSSPAPANLLAKSRPRAS